MADLAKFYPELAEWNRFAANGEFVVPRCRACGRAHWYPRARCPFCFSADVGWEEASGDGTIYAFSATPSGDNVVAYVTLAEGPTILTNLVGADPAELRIGQPVRVVLQSEGADGPFPRFAPVTAG